MSARKIAPLYAGLGLLVLAGFAQPSAALAARHEARSGELVFSIDEATGAYSLDDGKLHFSGHLADGPVHVTRKAARLSFPLTSAIVASVSPAPGKSSALLFSWTNTGRRPVTSPPAFPDFTRVPAGLHSVSHRQENFSPPVFDDPQDAATPWLLFGNSGPALVVSPVSDVFLASMLGDAKTRVAVGMNSEVRELPAGFTARSLVAAGPSVTAAYDAWGTALRAIHSRPLASPDADPTLRKIGILTDNAGGHYYYNYEYADGLNYEDSLVRFVKRSRDAGLPFGYMQLDSWWYPKSNWNPHEKIGDIKNAALPRGAWNRYGGMVEWKADPGVFPKGIAAFHERVKMPFLAHNRFIDKESPYRSRFEISGLAGIDRGYWNELANYAAQSSVAVYLQDWLDAIYKFSPELHTVPGKGQAFLDNMASAMAVHGISLQYCMGYPLEWLQGAKYPNLTTIRAAGDGLTRSKWVQLAFNARVIREIGAWPATDVMPSGDTAAMLFAALSGGPVGIGDGFEQIDRANIFKVARADGEIVKPDDPLTPISQSYLSETQKTGKPIIASTYTRHEGHVTAYVLAFAGNAQTSGQDFSMTPAELGFRQRVAVFDPETQSLVTRSPSASISGKLTGRDSYSYRVVAPISRSGIALLGDIDKFVPMGRKRITSYHDAPDGALLDIAVAPRETNLTIAGYAPSKVTANAVGASITSIDRDPTTGLFKLRLHISTPDVRKVTLKVRRGS